MSPAQLEELGRMLARGGPAWARYLEAARELWRGTGAWSIAHAAHIAGALGIGPKPLRRSRECPRCGNPPPGQWNGRRTVLSLPDRYTSKCARCDTEWWTPTERHPLEPFETR